MNNPTTDAASATARRLLIVGPPGAGKGTQAVRVAEELGIPAISTGDIFRANVSGETELGVLAKSYMDKGEYVPDSVTNDMIRSRLAEADAQEGFLLDGYPRTLDQVEALGVPAISTGDIFRANVKGETELGKLAKRYKDAGEYVPDEVTAALREALAGR